MFPKARAFKGKPSIHRIIRIKELRRGARRFVGDWPKKTNQKYKTQGGKGGNCLYCGQKEGEKTGFIYVEAFLGRRAAPKCRISRISTRERTLVIRADYGVQATLCRFGGAVAMGKKAGKETNPEILKKILALSRGSGGKVRSHATKRKK